MSPWALQTFSIFWDVVELEIFSLVQENLKITDNDCIYTLYQWEFPHTVLLSYLYTIGNTEDKATFIIEITFIQKDDTLCSSM